MEDHFVWVAPVMELLLGLMGLSGILFLGPKISIRHSRPSCQRTRLSAKCIEGTLQVELTSLRSYIIIQPMRVML